LNFSKNDGRLEEKKKREEVIRMMLPLVLSQRIYSIIFDWRNKKHLGLINRQKKIITINIELFVVIMLIHELLHEKHPLLREEEIIAKAWRVIDRMKTVQIRQLARKLLPDNFNKKKQTVFLW
jgi:hypothetical protein